MDWIRESVRRAIVAAVAALGVLAGMVTPRSVAAQVAWDVEIDNDALNAPPLAERSDRDYTHGMRLRVIGAGISPVGRWLWPGVPRCGSTWSGEPCLNWALEVSQVIFTPLTSTSVPDPGDRAYAGWIGASLQTRVVAHPVEHSVIVSVGVTGAPALAGPTQRSFHRLIGGRAPAGWSGQLATEPTLDVMYTGAYTGFRWVTGNRIGVQMIPAWSIALGTVHRAATVGVEGRIALGAPGSSDWRDHGFGGPAPGAYLLAAIRGSAVAGDLFLDGGFFRHGVRVGHRGWVGQLEVGVGARVHGIGVEWRVIKRSQAYPTQARPHAYSTIAISR